MPSLIDLRRRIRSVKNTQQITKAMKVVSAAKLRRAQDRVLAARPYAEIIQRMLANVAQAAAEQNAAEEIELRMMTLEGILSIQAGDNPRVVQEKLITFVAPADRVDVQAACTDAHVALERHRMFGPHHMPIRSPLRGSGG